MPICKNYLYHLLRFGYKNPSSVECDEDSDCDHLHHPSHNDVDYFMNLEAENILLKEENTKLKEELKVR